MTTTNMTIQTKTVVRGYVIVIGNCPCNYKECARAWYLLMLNKLLKLMVDDVAIG